MGEAFSLIHKTDGVPNNKAVIMFHGLTGTPGELYHFGEALYNAGYDVYCPILPGHCAGTEAIKKVKWEDWHLFALNEFDTLALKYANVYTSGICLGAVMALAVTLDRQNVKGVVALSTTLFFDGWSIPPIGVLLPLGVNTIFKFLYAFPEEGPLGVKNHETREKVRNSLDSKKENAALDSFPLLCVHELLKMSKFLRQNLYKVDVPLLIVHSRKDDLSSIKSANIIYNKAASKNKELLILENSYHLVSIDNEKDFVFSKSVEFLNKSSFGYKNG